MLPTPRPLARVAHGLAFLEKRLTQASVREVQHRLMAEATLTELPFHPTTKQADYICYFPRFSRWLRYRNSSLRTLPSRYRATSNMRSPSANRAGRKRRPARWVPRTDPMHRRKAARPLQEAE